MSGKERPQRTVTSTRMSVALRVFVDMMHTRPWWNGESSISPLNDLSSFFQDLRQVQSADPAANAAQSARDVHQATGIRGDDSVGAALFDERRLVGHHGAADVRKT